MIRGVHHYLCMFNSCQFVQTLKNCRSLTIDHVVHRHMCCAYLLELACSWQCIICLMAIALVLNEVDTIPGCFQFWGYVYIIIYIYIIQIDYWLYVISSELKYQLVLFSSPLSDISQNFCLGQLHVAAPKGSSAFQSLGWAFHGGQLDGSWKSHGSPMEKSMEKSHGLVKDGEREHPFFRDFVWEKWENTQLASWNQA